MPLTSRRYQAISVEPNSVTFLSNRAAALMSANRYEDALADTKQADEIEPLNPKVLHRLARIYTALGRPQDALDVFDRIASVKPVTAQEKAAALSMQKHVKQAEDSLREGTAGSMAIHAIDQAERGLGAGADKPRKWQLMRGEAYLRMGNVNALGDAQGVAMALLRKNKQDPEALVLRGRALYGQGDNEQALQHFREALSCDPDFKDGIKYLRIVQKLDRLKEQGNTAFKAFKYRDAVEIYGKALEVDPQNKGTNSKILQNRAMAYIKVLPRRSSKRKTPQANCSVRSKITNPRSLTLPVLSLLTPPTSKPAELEPALLANLAPGKTPSANTAQ